MHTHVHVVLISYVVVKDVLQHHHIPAQTVESRIVSIIVDKEVYGSTEDSFTFPTKPLHATSPW